jgi:hypothetical protein
VGSQRGRPGRRGRVRGAGGGRRGLPGTGQEGQPGCPALVQVPGPSAPDHAEQAVLAARGLEVIPISADGDCLMNALLASAPAEAFGDTNESADLREELARFLATSDGQRRPVLERARGKCPLVPGARPGRPHPGPASRHQPGEWAHASADLAPAVAAAAFGLDLTIVHPRQDSRPTGRSCASASGSRSARVVAIIVTNFTAGRAVTTDSGFDSEPYARSKGFPGSGGPP